MGTGRGSDEFVDDYMVIVVHSNLNDTREASTACSGRFSSGLSP